MDRVERRQLSEWPSFWVALFSGFALLASVAVAPRFAVRQTRLERMADSREIIRQRQLKGSPAEKEKNPSSPADAFDPYEPTMHRVQLVTLRVVLAAVFFAASFRVRKRLREPALRQSSAPAANDPASEAAASTSIQA